MRQILTRRAQADAWRTAPALAALAVACAAAFGAPAALAQQPADPALAQLQQQLLPMPDSQLQVPAAQPAVQQVQAAPQALPTVAPQQPPPQAALQPPAQPVIAPAPPLPAPVVAAEPPAKPPRTSTRASDIGSSTEAWLELQRSNRAASDNPHPFEGAAASYAYQRYLDSFGTPIPAWFGSSQAAQGSSGGGSSFGSGQSQ
ncbi:DUF3613 domain-containing protein [Burkholderia sp. 22PA0106]|uniref:DUF3613 domain-containing protein n=1 Tax=Burkholderia sp. 22PA0106 TaxID=3237371 RepID=UPI0039C13E61